MLQIQGAMVSGKSAQVIATSGNPFIPFGVNVAGKGRSGEQVPAQWKTVRVFGSPEVLQALQARVTTQRSLLVRSYVTDRVSTYTAADGTVKPSLTFAADVRRLAVYDNEARTWRPALEFLGLAAPAAAAVAEPEEFSEDLPF